jgi:ATPase subunit of ABC transporter with duplicated ATPase domains
LLLHLPLLLLLLLLLPQTDCDKLPPPVLPFQDVSFSYSGNEEGMLYKNLEFGIDCDSRIALVGPNGAGGWQGVCVKFTA